MLQRGRPEARFLRWRLLLSLIFGIALALAYPNYNLPLLGWVAVAGLMLACVDATPWEGALCGFVFGLAFYSFSLPWIYTVMRQYGPLPVPEAAGVMALMVCALSLYLAAFALAVAWMWRRAGKWALFAAPFLWVAVELVRSRVPNIGFAWDLLGYTAAGNLALVQTTPITGIYGLSLLVAAYNALLVWCLLSARPRWKRRPARVLAASTAGLLLIVLIGPRFVPHAQASAVAHLVQTDLPQSTDYTPDWAALHAGDMAQLENISVQAAQKEPGLIVWPEVPAPFSMQQAAFATLAQGIARNAGSDFLLGVVAWEPALDGIHPYNSAVLLDPSGRQLFQYDKIHLVPFSEYVPWRGFFWFAKDLTSLVGEFHHGAVRSVGNLPGGRFSVFICYEAVFPNEVRQFARRGADLLINISDDGWFGRSSAAAQHVAMARVRAVENRRWLLRDTNNGFTVSVDPYGRITASMPPDIRGQLDAPYGFRTDLTPYTRWGDWIAWLSLALALWLLLWAALRAKPVKLTGRGNHPSRTKS